MIDRVLVAIEDTQAALRAAVVAADLAHRLDCRLCVVTVPAARLAAALEAALRESAVSEWRDRMAASVLGHVV